MRAHLRHLHLAHHAPLAAYPDDDIPAREPAFRPEPLDRRRDRRLVAHLALDDSARRQPDLREASYPCIVAFSGNLGGSHR